jgi:putative NADH-flavin reductase
MRKKIALFGATGQTGKQFLQLALAAGYEVKSLARTPSSITETNPLLSVIKGDVLNADDVAKVVAGADIVVSLFGHIKDSPEWVQTNGTKNIVKAMEVYGVQKIISLSGGGLPYPAKDEPKFVDKFIRTIMKIAVPKVLNDAIRHHEVLANSKLNWIIVRAPRLTNDPKTGNYRVGWVGVNASTKISRADMAAFILTQVEDDSFIKQMPFVSI